MSRIALSLTTAAITVLSSATAGDLYKWTDDKGGVHYSSTLPPETAKKAATIDSSSLSNINALPSNPNKTRADGTGPAAPASWAPVEAASNDNSAATPASPPALIPPSLLAPSNPPTAQPTPAAQSDLVEVVAQGMGVDANSALLNAYSNAVQQALGLYVDAETMVQNDQIVQDKILTYSKGFIQEATTVKQSQANGLFQVNIRAKVKRQQLLEQAKANNITVKAVEGVSLHAQVESQLKQEADAKALLEKALLPLMGTTFHRAEIAPSTQQQPNPIINKEGTDDGFVTLDYKINLWIDEQKYLQYVTSNLVPILEQIATDKGTFTNNFKRGDKAYENPTGIIENKIEHEKITAGNEVFNILIWKDKSMTSSKWKWYAIKKENIKSIINEEREKLLKKVGIELSLLDKDNQTIALGNIVLDYNQSINQASYRALWTNSNFRTPNSDANYYIAPYFVHNTIHYLGRCILYPKVGIISIKISREDLPRVVNSKLEVM